MKSFIVLILIGFVYFFVQSCSTSEAKKINEFEGLSLQQSIDKFKASPFIKNASFGFCVISTKTGKVLYSADENRSLVPASSFKILTTAASLALLGDTFKYETKIAYTGEITNGVLNGNVYIVGGGDPTLGSSKFVGSPNMDEVSARFVKKIKDLGINQVNGNVISYNNYFGENIPPPNWLWQDIGNYYGAMPCGLNFNDNTFHLIFQTGAKKGDSTKITKMYPEIPGLRIVENKVMTDNVGSGDNAYIYGAPFDNDRYCNGTLPPNYPNFWIQAAIPNPPLFCAQFLMKKASTNGLKITGKADVTSTLPTNLKYIHTHYSADLSRIVYKTLLESNNLYTEVLLKTLGKIKKKDGSLNSGIEVLKNFCATKMTDTTGLTITDASGLSRTNLISAKQLASYLYKLTQDKAYSTFFDCMPVSGGPGLTRVGNGTLAQGNMRAKSGYMSKVKSYAGYVNTKSGEKLAFAFIVNGYTCSQYYITPIMEPILIKIAELE